MHLPGQYRQLELKASVGLAELRARCQPFTGYQLSISCGSNICTATLETFISVQPEARI